MTWKDKMELGLKNDAGRRKDNLTPEEVRGPEVDAGPGRSPVIPAAKGDKTEVPEQGSPEQAAEDTEPPSNSEE
jgi:hypothetical protein